MAAHDDTLQRFVHEALARGMARSDIHATLSKAGWPEEQIRNSLAAFADVDSPIPVPRPRPYVSAGEAFLYLLLFTALYTTAFNLGSLTFDLINRAFPDPAASSFMAAYWRSAMRWSMAAMIVSFPVF